MCHSQNKSTSSELYSSCVSRTDTHFTPISVSYRAALSLSEADVLSSVCRSCLVEQMEPECLICINTCFFMASVKGRPVNTVDAEQRYSFVNNARQMHIFNFTCVYSILFLVAEQTQKINCPLKVSSCGSDSLLSSSAGFFTQSGHSDLNC